MILNIWLLSLQSSVPYQEMPTYNDKRRSKIPMATISNLQRSRSNPQLALLFRGDTLNRGTTQTNGDGGGAYELTPYTERSYRSNENGVDESHHSDSPRSMSISSTGSYPSTSTSMCIYIALRIWIYISCCSMDFNSFANAVWHFEFYFDFLNVKIIHYALYVHVLPTAI